METVEKRFKTTVNDAENHYSEGKQSIVHIPQVLFIKEWRRVVLVADDKGCGKREHSKEQQKERFSTGYKHHYAHQEFGNDEGGDEP